MTKDSKLSFQLELMDDFKRQREIWAAINIQRYCFKNYMFFVTALFYAYQLRDFIKLNCIVNN